MILLIPVAIGLVWLAHKLSTAPVIETCDTTDCGCRWGSLDHRGEAS